jgi:hypothetical protein
MEEGPIVFWLSVHARSYWLARRRCVNALSAFKGDFVSSGVQTRLRNLSAQHPPPTASFYQKSSLCMEVDTIAKLGAFAIPKRVHYNGTRSYSSQDSFVVASPKICP